MATEARGKAFASGFLTITKPLTFSRSNSEPESSKQRLFSGAKESTKDTATASRAISTMNEAMVNMRRRGEVLDQTAEKSEQLKNASAEFANLAKALKEKQKNRWF